MDINETGTILRYTPGILTGGKISHDCSSKRSIAWYLEAIVPLALFSKDPLHLTLTGITNDNKDSGVDFIKEVTIKTLKIFGMEEPFAR